MDLLDDAISEFQMAFRTAGLQDLEGDYIHCCNMLGVCFKRKQMHKVAIMWFERGLKITGRLEDEYQALRFEIGLCYEEMGEIEEAIEAFTGVYGIDVNYRKVGEKIKQLQAGDVQALVAQKPYDIGFQGVEQAANALTGGSVTAKIDTESLIVTKDNLNDPAVNKYIYKDKC